MNKIFKNYIYNFLYQMFVLIVPLVLSPYLARVLGATNLGIYSYIYSACSIISTISLIGTYNYGTRQIAYVRDDKNAIKQIYWDLFWLRILLGGAGIVVYYIIACVSEYTIYFILFSGWLIAGVFDPSWMFVGVEEMGPTVLKIFVVKLVTVLLIFLFVNGTSDLWKYELIMGGTMLISTAVLLFQAQKYIGGGVKKASNLKENLRGSFNLFLPQVASLFYLQVDKVMLKMLSDNINQVSFYDQAEKIVTVPLTFITVLNTVMMPRIANEYALHNNEKISYLLTKAGKTAVMMAFPMTVGLFCVAQGLIPWYLGNEFLPTATAIMILCPIIISNSLAGISGNQFFTATNQIGILSKAYVSAAVMNVVVNAILIPRYGFVGAAIATVMSSYASVFIQYFYLNKQIKMTGLLVKCIQYAVGALIMGGCVWTLKKYLSISILSTAIEALVGVTLYVIFLCLTRDKVFFELCCDVKKFISGILNKGNNK